MFGLVSAAWKTRALAAEARAETLRRDLDAALAAHQQSLRQMQEFCDRTSQLMATVLTAVAPRAPQPPEPAAPAAPTRGVPAEVLNTIDDLAPEEGPMRRHLMKYAARALREDGVTPDVVAARIRDGDDAE